MRRSFTVRSPMSRYVSPGAQQDRSPNTFPGQRELEETGRQALTQEQYNSMPGVHPDNNTTDEPVSAVVERTVDL